MPRNFQNSQKIHFSTKFDVFGIVGKVLQLLSPPNKKSVANCESGTLSLGYIDLKVGFQRGKDTPLGDSPYPFGIPNLDHFTIQSGKSNLPLKGRVLFSIWVSNHEESEELEEEKTEKLKIKSIPLKVTCVCIRIRIRRLGGLAGSPIQAGQNQLAKSPYAPSPAPNNT
ncbi:hypothetical protein IEQ34_009704 [Dendrobium chrysotoxum]|uniref:Uncharacterized protein n=1 Tax=Dendrobium chrysotoxum TaxID=161865 RepID=A0AAV7H256_DENCH|nr:hypothetical protein IEQ34_009704 [Dendrobium chrysotoxum]